MKQLATDGACSYLLACISCRRWRILLLADKTLLEKELAPYRDTPLLKPDFQIEYDAQQNLLAYRERCRHKPDAHGDLHRNSSFPIYLLSIRIAYRKRGIFTWMSCERRGEAMGGIRIYRWRSLPRDGEEE